MEGENPCQGSLNSNQGGKPTQKPKGKTVHCVQCSKDIPIGELVDGNRCPYCFTIIYFGA